MIYGFSGLTVPTVGGTAPYQLETGRLLRLLSDLVDRDVQAGFTKAGQEFVNAQQLVLSPSAWQDSFRVACRNMYATYGAVQTRSLLANVATYLRSWFGQRSPSWETVLDPLYVRGIVGVVEGKAPLNTVPVNSSFTAQSSTSTVRSVPIAAKMSALIADDSSGVRNLSSILTRPPSEQTPMDRLPVDEQDMVPYVGEPAQEESKGIPTWALAVGAVGLIAVVSLVVLNK